MSNFYGELLIRITSDTAGLSRGLKQGAAETNAASAAMASAGNKARVSWERVGLGMQNVGRTMSQFVTLPIVAGFAYATYAGYKYSKALLQIQNLTGLTAAETERYGTAMLNMSKYGVGPQKLAESMYFISSSGFKAKEALKVLDVAAKASASGMGEIQPVADVLTSAMNAYGHSNLSAARATDILMKTIEVGKAEPQALATSLGRIMPVAAKLSVPLGQVGGAIAGLTLTGLSAAEAVTSLRGTMIALAAPAKMSIKELDRLGLSYQDVTRSIKDKGLIATMQMLYEKTDGNMLAMRKIIPNVRALNGVLSLLGPNYKRNVAITKAVIDSNGKLAASFEVTAKTPIQKFRVALASIQSSFIKLGIQIMPTVASIVSGIASIIASFGRLPDGIKNVLLIGAAFAAVTGPVIMVTGSIVRSAALIKGAFASLRGVAAVSALSGAGSTAGAAATTTGIRSVGLAAASILGPVALAAVAVTALTVGIALLAKHRIDPTGENWKRNTEALARYLGLVETVQKRTIEVPVKLVMKDDTKRTDRLIRQGTIVLDVNDVKAWGAVNRLRDYIANPRRWTVDMSAHLNKVDTLKEIVKNIDDLGKPVAGHKLRLAAEINHENLLKGLEVINMTQKIPPVKVPFDIEMGLASKAKVNKWFKSLSKPQQILYTLQVRDEQAVSAMKTVDSLSARLTKLKAQKTTPEIRAKITDLEAKLNKAIARLLKVGGMAPNPKVTVNNGQALSAIDQVIARMSSIQNKSVTLSIMQNYTTLGKPAPGHEIDLTPHSGGVYDGPHSGYLALMHSKEAVLPLDHPNLIPGILAKAGLAGSAMRAGGSNVSSRGNGGDGSPTSAAAPAGDTLVSVYLDSEPIAARVEVRQLQKERRNARTRAKR